MALRMTGAPDEPELVGLPWSLPLEQWPAKWLVGLPRGLSRHVVRFVRVRDSVYAVKEIGAYAAYREYDVLRRMERLGVPSVQAIGIVDGRASGDGAPLETALVTRHLEFSLPYRALFSRTLRHDTTVRLLDALAVLLVRLHLSGFYWGDCSLSNTLFRRDAGSFAAYLVDAETTEFHEVLSEGQRAYDVDLARTNIIGELMDLQAGDLLDATVEPVVKGDTIAARYAALWLALTEPEVFRVGERHRVEARVRRLNELGFDVAELDVSTDVEGGQVRIQPKVVDAGHHARRLLRLTGLDVEENQARRLLNDLDAFRSKDREARDGESEQISAHRWLTQVFHPVVESVPRELRGKLEPAEVFHEVLEHRWFLSEQAGRGVRTAEAAASYVADVLRHKPDEKAVLAPVQPP